MAEEKNEGKLTPDQVIEKLRANRVELESLGDKELLGDFEIVDSKGGHEGGGDYAMVVMHFKEHDVYIKEEGYYNSYDGTEWSGNFESVKPLKKEITVYE